MKPVVHNTWTQAWRIMHGGFEMFSPELAMVIRYDSTRDMFLRRDHSNRDGEWTQVIPDSKFFSCDDWITMSSLDKDDETDR